MEVVVAVFVGQHRFLGLGGHSGQLEVAWRRFLLVLPLRVFVGVGRDGLDLVGL